MEDLQNATHIFTLRQVYSLSLKSCTTTSETPFFTNLCRVTGKIVHRKVYSFLHTYIDSCSSAYIDPNSIFASRFLKLMIYFWFPVTTKDTAAFPRKDKEFSSVAFCYATFCNPPLQENIAPTSARYNCMEYEREHNPVNSPRDYICLFFPSLGKVSTNRSFGIREAVRIN